MIRYINTRPTHFWKGKTCIVRIDLNISNEKNSLSPFRLMASVPTIRFLYNAGATIILISHRGRPQGIDEKFSLKPYTRILGEQVKQKISFIPYSKISAIKAQILRGERKIYLLENLRFFKGEEKNSVQFARELASLGEIYVNDGFAVLHREHTSVCAITKYIPSYGGLLLQKELTALREVMKKPESPCVVILGGAKIADKIGVMKYFWKKADYFLFGGGPANTLLAARGMNMRNSLFDRTIIPKLQSYLHSHKIRMPVDFRIDAGRILDIGEKTIAEFRHILDGAQTVIWNGPMGLFEQKEFQAGTKNIWSALLAKKQNTKIVVGGGETVNSLNVLLGEKVKLPKNIFLSTGGGAMLEYLSGKKLPGIEALQ